MPAEIVGRNDSIVGFLDIGTNSIRLLVVRIQAGHGYSVLTQQKEAVRLGEGEFDHQYLQPEAMSRAVLVCRKFGDLARSYGAEDVIAVATSATREARNQAAFLKRLEDEAQLSVHVVSGNEEARLIYLGIASGLHLADKRALFIDIGGGSTELIVGDQQQYQYLDSLKLGAMRLTGLYLPDQGAVSANKYGQLQRHIRSTAVRAVHRIRQFELDLAIGSSGTIMNLADIAIRMAFKRKRERDDVMTHKQLKDVAALLCSLSLEERKKVPGMNPDRADIIIAGAAVADTVMDECRLPELRISDRGLRDGLLVDYLARTGHGPLLTTVSVRLRSVLQLGRTCGFDEAHARNVARLAVELFDSARRVKLHAFGDWERELLEYAALLHDVGAFLSYDNHQQHSYYLIRNADLPGFDQTELAIMANVALFHRKALPRKKNPEFAALDTRSQKLVQALCVLLRLAESLDRSREGLVTHVEFKRGPDSTVQLFLECRDDCQLELWGVQNHRETFERIFRRPLEISLSPTRAPFNATTA